MRSQGVVFLGNVFTSTSLKEFKYLDGYVVVENGKISKVGPRSDFPSYRASFEALNVVELKPSQFLMPGLVDCHTHSSQYPNVGLGLDRPLVEWLKKYIYNLESQFSDTIFAHKVYDKVVKRLLKNGTTTACYFASLHYEGTKELVSACLRHGQRAFVGKVSMMLPNNAGYYNDLDTELRESRMFLDHVKSLKSDLVQAIVTPRSGLSCDVEQMKELASLAEEYDLMLQSHISESKDQIEFVMKKNPWCKGFVDVYDKGNILNNKSIMAHAVYLSEDEMQLLSERGVSVAHCPASNTRLMSGLCPVRNLLNHSIKVGLGTDVSGGDNMSMLDCLRRCLDISAHLTLKGEETEPINWREGFYLATLGGAEALNISENTGSLEVGKDFDALVIDVYQPGGPIDNYNHSVASTLEEEAAELMQKFIYLGDDRNIVQVYVQGVDVKKPLVD